MYLGIDIGSSTSKAVIIDNAENLISQSVVPLGTGTEGSQQAIEKALKNAGLDASAIKKTVVTGYGRMLYENSDKQITEISCHARGISKCLDGVHSLIDIGGQDSKFIKLSPDGYVENFVINEKCAAGTGRFLEVVGRVVGEDIDRLSALADKGKEGVNISNTCTVFAESEMISQLAKGKKIEDVTLGALKSIASRVAGMCSRLSYGNDVIAMSGGVALNKRLVQEIQKELDTEIKVPDDPQTIGALGAALYAKEL